MPRGVRLPRVTLTCQQCNEPFSANGSKAKAYESRGGQTVKFCSKGCADAAKLMARPTFECVTCGETAEKNRIWHKDRQAFGGYVHHQSYCSDECRTAARRARSAAPREFDCETCGTHVVRSKDEKGRWDARTRFCSRSCSAQSTMGATRGQGVGHLDKWGYRILSVNGAAIPEHRYVMEQLLGRKLFAEETVHHVNGVRTDNRPENLELWSSRHGRGQRVEDKIRWCVAFLADYPEVLSSMGLVLVGRALALSKAAEVIRSPFDSIQ